MRPDWCPMTSALAILGAVGTLLWVAAVLVVLLRYRSSSGVARGRLQWLACGAVVTATVGLAGMALSLLVDWPPAPASGMAVGCLVLPLSIALGRPPQLALRAERVLVHTIVLAGLVALVGSIYLLVVIGLGRVPVGHERTTLALSMTAAAVACVLAFPARRRLEEWANQRVYGERHSPDEALRTFGGRMSRAVPMDELLLQLLESLQEDHAADRRRDLDREPTASCRARCRCPSGARPSLHLRGEERSVVARAHAQGNAWIEVWAPALLEGRDGCLVRSVSVAHLGELLGLIVLERRADDAPFTDEEDRVLVELARQVGLALHNVRLDSALQASLDELKVRNAQLVASRARIVAAADESRRQIERNLHDGAQQHLVALAVKVGLDQDADGVRPRHGRHADRRAARRRAGDAHRAARAGPRHLPPAAPRPWPERGPADRGQPGRPADHRRGPGHRPLPRRRRGGGLLLLPRGGPERGQARR